jgi:hypothetical protein
MADMTLRISCRRKWWFGIAVSIGYLLLRYRLVGSRPSAEHYGGIIGPTERVTSWIVRHALVIDAL